jgi:dCTP deaminase
MVKNDRWIRKMALEHKMIEPFVEKQISKGVISYGLSSYGYDIRIADEFKIFTSVNPDLFATGQPVVVDPKNFNEHSFVDYKGEVCVIPPNSFALGRSVEYFRIPEIFWRCVLGKARMRVVVL